MTVPTGVRPLVLAMLDGWGVRAECEANALALARTPIYDRLAGSTPHTILAAAGEAVGLPAGKPGNAQAGYMTLGAGRPVEQELIRINRAIQGEDGQAIANHPAFHKMIQRVRPLGGAVHLIGLVSPAGIAGHQNHLAVLAALLSHEGVQVWIHAVMDGQDTRPQSGIEYLAEFMDDIAGAQHAALGSIMGRGFGFDEPADPAMVQAAWKALAAAEAPRAEYPAAYLDQCYARGLADDRVPPAIAANYRGIRRDDAICLVNLRPDIAHTLTAALVDPAFNGFTRPSFNQGGGAPFLSGAFSLTHMGGTAGALLEPLFAHRPSGATLSEALARAGRSQLLLTETAAEANLCLYLRGGHEQIYPGETIRIAQTPPAAKMEKRPELAAADLVAEALTAIRDQSHDLLILNLPNVALLGRIGNLRATIEAAEAIDKHLGKLAAQIEKRGGVLAVTSAYGKGEIMIDPETGGPWRATTASHVPFMLAGARGAMPGKGALRTGTLADIAPTMLDLLGIAAPDEMTGRSLLTPSEEASHVLA